MSQVAKADVLEAVQEARAGSWINEYDDGGEWVYLSELPDAVDGSQPQEFGAEEGCHLFGERKENGGLHGEGRCQRGARRRRWSTPKGQGRAGRPSPFIQRNSGSRRGNGRLRYELR